MSSWVAATSTASLMAIPSEPVESGSSARIVRPAFVSGDGEGTTDAPKAWIIERRYGFCR